MTDGLAEQGWSNQATPLEGASVRCEACGGVAPAAGVRVDSMARVEGASDPDDMAVVIGLTCPLCSAADAMVLAYGPGASGADADVLKALPDPPSPPPG